MASHGLLKQPPYGLAASPFPVSRGCVGAISSWSGALHTQDVTGGQGHWMQFIIQRLCCRFRDGPAVAGRASAPENRRRPPAISRFWENRWWRNWLPDREMERSGGLTLHPQNPIINGVLVALGSATVGRGLADSANRQTEQVDSGVRSGWSAAKRSGSTSDPDGGLGLTSGVAGRAQQNSNRRIEWPRSS